MAKNKMVKIGLLTMAMGFVIEAVILVGYVPAVKEALVLATTKNPESFTELYFENHTNLPKKIEGSEQYKFTFTIHNLENKDMVFPYVVYLQIGNRKRYISQDTVVIKNNESKSVDETIGPLENLRTKVVVELTNKNQIISFWMEGGNPPSIQ